MKVTTGLTRRFLLFTNLSQLKSAIIGIIKRKFYSRGEGMFKKIIDSLLGKKKYRSYSSSDYRHRKENVKAVASFQVADEMASYTSFI